MRLLAIIVIVHLLLIPKSLLSQVRASNTSSPTTFGADTLLTRLAGIWHFDMYSADRDDPVASGQREMRLMSDSTKLTWTEGFDGRSDTGVGILGNNVATGAYYLLGVYTHEPNPVVLMGRAQGSTIAFDPLPTNVVFRAGTFVASELRLIDGDHFEWRATDGRWRTVFTRIQRP